MSLGPHDIVFIPTMNIQSGSDAHHVPKTTLSSPRLPHPHHLYSLSSFPHWPFCSKHTSQLIPMLAVRSLSSSQLIPMLALPSVWNPECLSSVVQGSQGPPQPGLPSYQYHPSQHKSVFIPIKFDLALCYLQTSLFYVTY